MNIKVKNGIYISVTLILSFLLFLMGYYSFNRIVKKVDFPSIFGYSVARTVSGSMQPEINVNDVILIRRYDNYSVGDVVTYRNGESYVTHRIVDVLDTGAYVTKGDFNDVEDELPVAKSAIQGKVVHSFGGGLWNLVEKTWTAQGLIIFLIIVSLLTFTPYIVQYVKYKKSDLDDEKKEMNYGLRHGIFHTSMFVLFLSIMIVSMAKITDVRNASDHAIVADFAIGVDDSNIVSIDMENLKPGDQKEFDISIKNKRDNTTSKVAQDYNIFLKLYPADTENVTLPLKFSIEPISESVSGIVVPSEDVELDATTHTGKTSTGKMPATNDVIAHEYTIKVEWPETETDHIYANQSNKFEVLVKSKQLDEYN